jgi:hypothetical protein
MLVDMSMSQIAGILPAVVFPAATAFQLFQMLRARSATGVSAATWALFGCANIAMYVYAERYWEWQAILGTLVTAGLDFAIAGLALAAKRAPSTPPTGMPDAERIPGDELSFRR